MKNASGKEIANIPRIHTVVPLPIGSVIVKKSLNPFKSGNKTGVITEIGVNPNTERQAYLMDDGSWVDAFQCELYDPIKIHHAGKVIFHVFKSDDSLMVCIGDVRDWQKDKCLSDFYSEEIGHIVGKICEKFGLSETQESTFEVAELFNPDVEETWEHMTNETVESLTKKMIDAGCQHSEKFSKFIEKGLGLE